MVGFFLGAAAAAAAGGTALGFGILAGLPTCALRGTVACGGVTAGGPVGATIGCAGVVAMAPPPTCTCCRLAWTFNCCLAFFNLAFVISCFLSDRISLLKNSFRRDLPMGVSASQCMM